MQLTYNNCKKYNLIIGIILPSKRHIVIYL